MCNKKITTEGKRKGQRKRKCENKMKIISPSKKGNRVVDPARVNHHQITFINFKIECEKYDFNEFEKYELCKSCLRITFDLVLKHQSRTIKAIS